MRLVWGIAYLFLSASSVLGQTPVPPPVDSTIVDSSKVDSLTTPAPKSDTILFVPPLFKGEMPVSDSVNLEKRLIQNPTKALFKSLVIPGWGQLGNGRVKKAIIFAGLQGWCIGATIHYGNSASNFKREYTNAVPVVTRNQYYSLYKDRRQERNKYIFFLGLTTLVSVFDAYVDAHLSGSPADQTQKIGLNVAPSGDGMHASLALSF